MIDRSTCDAGTLDREPNGYWRATCRFCPWSIRLRSTVSAPALRSLSAHIAVDHQIVRGVDWTLTQEHES